MGVPGAEVNSEEKRKKRGREGNPFHRGSFAPVQLRVCEFQAYIPKLIWRHLYNLTRLCCSAEVLLLFPPRLGEKAYSEMLIWNSGIKTAFSPSS